MKFKILGAQIYVSFLFCAVVCVMIIFDKTGLIVPTLLAVLLHELGHLLAMWALDCSPKEIKLIPTGVQITTNLTSKYKTDVVVSLCGSLVNFFMFFVLILNYIGFKNYFSLVFAFLNLLSILNILFHSVIQ